MARIWLVDDQQQWRELYESALADAGHEVRVYESGSEALADMTDMTATAERPDLVVLDVQMNPSGAEVLRQMRAQFPDLPVVMNTSCPGCPERAELAAATGFVTKNTDPTPLLQAISQALARDGAA
jgi:CheY-like chemotaxis protein